MGRTVGIGARSVKGSGGIVMRLKMCNEYTLLGRSVVAPDPAHGVVRVLHPPKEIPSPLRACRVRFVPVRPIIESGLERGAVTVVGEGVHG